MAQQEDWLGLVEVRGIFFSLSCGFFFILYRICFFFFISGSDGPYLFVERKSVVLEVGRDTAGGAELAIIFFPLSGRKSFF